MIRKVWLAGLAAVMLYGCNSESTDVSTAIVNNPQSASDEAPAEMPEMTFEEEVYDFGEISQGEKAKHVYKFTNTGEAELVVTHASASCGCTVPSYSKEPIAPGGKGEIEVEFDSEGKSGKIHKKVSIVANTHPATTVIAIKGFVVAPTENK
ncbi:MAG: DUF1573 domain-containing protein [Bacteroidota bacterium]